MGSELRIELSGYRISVVRVGPEPPATADPIPPRSLESSTSSFELVGDRPEPAPHYSSPLPVASPYPLQAAGPSSGTSSSGLGLDLPSASRPVVRSLFSPEPEQHPLQGPRAPSVPAGHCGESSVEGSPQLVQARPVVAPAFLRTALSSPYRVPEYPLQGHSWSLEELEGAFPALPGELRDICRALRGGSLSGEARALRAWKAGCWARAILEGWSEVAKPWSRWGFPTESIVSLLPGALPVQLLCGPLPATRALWASSRGVGRFPTPSLPRQRPGFTLQVQVWTSRRRDGFRRPSGSRVRVPDPFGVYLAMAPRRCRGAGFLHSLRGDEKGWRLRPMLACGFSPGAGFVKLASFRWLGEAC